MKTVFTELLRSIVTLSMVLLLSLSWGNLRAQTASLTLAGRVLDPTGALVQNATVVIAQGETQLSATSGADGRYQFRNLAAGSYQLTVEAAGFAPLTQEVVLSANRQLDLSLKIAEEQQQVNVMSDTAGLSIASDQNANSVVLKGSDLDALSDDPEELLAEVRSLAGPSAGPDGGQLYIDGFSGGQLPPKSSILEIRINQNPFSAEYDRIGYGRINVLTKPGGTKFRGQINFGYLNSAFDTANSFATVQPSYQYYSLGSNITGPITKTSSYVLATIYWQRQKQSFIRAVDPANTAATLNEAFPTPFSTLGGSGRLDFQLGKHVVSVRGVLSRTRNTGNGVGALSLPQQASSSTNFVTAAQVVDSIVVNSHLVDEVAIQWIRSRSSQIPDFFSPTISVSGSFVTGGSSGGRSSDHQDNLEFHNYASLTTGTHFMRFGLLMRSSREAMSSTAGTNGSYTFQTLAQYQAGTPSIYRATVIQDPRSHILGFDAALFFQDEWRWKPNLNLGYGLRVEGQSRIHDRADWAPRISLTWAPGNDGKTPPKTSLNIAGGLFYNRFGLGSEMQTIRNNGINQQTYTVENPTFYDPNTSIPAATLSQGTASIPTIDTLDQHFHASENIQAAFGVTRMLGAANTLNVNYLYTRGVHQYLTNNISAPAFDPTTYTVTGPVPTKYVYQFQSGGIFKEHQLIVTSTTRYKKLSLRATYTFSKANSDTQGVGSVPSAGQNSRLDYGRATFGITHQLQLNGSYSAPFGITINPFLVTQSGTPYDITLGSDLTGNNQFNARPTYGACGAAGVVSTAFGCLDTNPTGKGEVIIPHNLGTGPANAVLNLVLLKNIGIGPRMKLPAGPNVAQSAGRPTAAANAPNGTAAKPVPLAPRRYTVALTLGATNIFNIVNLAPPNGVLSSPLFGKSQSPAGGAFFLSSPGNRTVWLQANFLF